MGPEYITYKDISTWSGASNGTIAAGSYSQICPVINIRFFKQVFVLGVQVTARGWEVPNGLIGDFRVDLNISGLKEGGAAQVFQPNANPPRWIIEKGIVRGDVCRYASADDSIGFNATIYLETLKANDVSGVVLYNIFYVIM